MFYHTEPFYFSPIVLYNLQELSLQIIRFLLCRVI